MHGLRGTRSGSERNVEIVRRFYDAFNRHNREEAAALFHPQIEWHTITAPLFGVDAMRGRDEVLRYMFEQIGEGIEDIRAILEELRELPSGQVLAVADYEGRGVASGVSVDMTTFGIYRVEAGEIVSFQDFMTRAEALKAAGLEE